MITRVTILKQGIHTGPTPGYIGRLNALRGLLNPNNTAPQVITEAQIDAVIAPPIATNNQNANAQTPNIPHPQVLRPVDSRWEEAKEIQSFKRQKPGVKEEDIYERLAQSYYGGVNQHGAPVQQISIIAPQWKALAINTCFSEVIMLDPRSHGVVAINFNLMPNLSRQAINDIIEQYDDYTAKTNNEVMRIITPTIQNAKDLLEELKKIIAPNAPVPLSTKKLNTH